MHGFYNVEDFFLLLANSVPTVPPEEIKVFFLDWSGAEKRMHWMPMHWDWSLG